MGEADLSPETVASKGKPVPQTPAAAAPLLVADTGWRAEEARDTRARLAAWEEDWDAPGMEAYDRL